jgi:energy-converting hydrogenase Eha subunit A
VRGATLLLWRARIRNSLARVIALGLLTALGGGMSLAVAAGAKRTSGAYDTILERSDSGEIASSYGPEDPDEARRRLQTTPGVGELTQLVGFGVSLPDTSVPNLSTYGYYNDPVVVDRLFLLQGHLPRAVNEIFLNEASAAQGRLAIGDELEVLVGNPASNFTEFVPEKLVVSGIGIINDEIYEDKTGAKPALIVSKRFIEEHRELILWGAASMKVAPGADRAETVRQLIERDFIVDNRRIADRDKAEGAIRPLVVTLAALAVLAGLAMITVVSQSLQRLVQRSPASARSLAATGCSRMMLVATDCCVAASVAIVGAIGAVGVAILASPLFPQGRARRISELQGIDVDVPVLALGALALIVALTGVVAVTSMRSARTGEPRPGRAPGILGAVPAIGTGMRFATGRRGLAGTIGSVAVGLMSIVAAVVFTGSMGGLVDRPELSGFSWDLAGREAYEIIDTDAVARTLRDDPKVERITGLTFSDVSVNGAPVAASVWAAVKGSPWPPLTGGRAPQGPNEVLMSPKTLADIDGEVGDTVAVRFADDNEEEGGGVVQFDLDMRIVGTAVSPVIGIPGSNPPRLDEGLLIRQEDLAGHSAEYGGAVLFDLDDGTDPAAVKAKFPEGLPNPEESLGGTEWFESAEPAEVIQANAAIDVLDLTIIALLLGVIGTVAHNLLGFVRQRRNAFAVLKALGFTPRQLRSTVLWQSGLVIGAALVLAVPLGIAAGRWLYQGFASGIGVIVEPVVPLLALPAAVLGAVALVQAVALVPAHKARRTNAAAELRLE